MRLPNGYGSISKLSGNRRKPYCVRVSVLNTETGCKNRKVLGYVKTRSEGLMLLAEYHKNPWSLNQKITTVEDVYNLWEKYKVPELSKTVAQQHRNRYKRYLLPLKDTPYADLNLYHFMEILNGNNLTNHAKTNLKKFFRQMDEIAFKFDIIQKEYTKLIGTFKTESKERIPFKEEEIKLLWNNLNIQDVDLVLILIYTGFKMGEFESIKLEDIDLNEWVIKGGSKTEAGKNRRVPIHKRIRPLLLKRMEQSKKETLLNYGSKAFRIRFKKVMQELNLNHIPHECRHTLRTRLDDAGANKVCIDLILGHASQGTGERIYTHKRIEQLHEAINLLN